jgi:GcrA cell cycle regulator
MTSQGWSDDRVETLKRLWLEGLSAAQVARQLGGVSRNAVIGKLHRLGLSGVRAASARPRRIAGPAARRARPTQPRRRPKPSVLPAAVLPIPVDPGEPGLVRDATGLRPHMCKWPIGDPLSDAFSFCGRPALSGGPYCPAHTRLAHRPTRAEPLDRDPVLRRLLAA